jgi:ppGpp synthetase/RelA/SpoT-type nucleotidyltranferase
MLEHRLQVHSTTSRVKSRDSYKRKLQLKGDRYRDISDVTDLAGIRIITYFSDQVDQVAQIVKREFRVDEENSIDKRLVLDPDRFGYLSMHYVVSLSDQRSALAEYRAFADLKAEVQIRSILQHAWAEIEHDLGYKTPGEVPKSVRRQFARLAGLLELADSEFVSIRNQIGDYQRQVAGRIESAPGAVELDKVSLLELIRSDEATMRLDKKIADTFGWRVRQAEDRVGGDVDKLAYWGLRTVADVKNALQHHRQHIIDLARKWAGKPDDFPPTPDTDSVPEGIALFYLCHILAGASQDFEKAASYYLTFSIGDGADTANELIAFMREEGRLTTSGADSSQDA